MNLQAISEAVEAYKQGASEADAARLDFFKGLFEIQQKRSDELGGAAGLPDLSKERAEQAYLSKEALFQLAPVHIDEVKFFGTCKLVADYLADNAGLEDDEADALRGVDWYKLASAFDLELAGSNPAQFVEDSLKSFDSLGLDSNVSSSLVMMAVSFALRSHLQEAAARLFALVPKDVRESARYEHPLLCPVCGSPGTASYVAASAGIDGRDRSQYCSTCGTMWPFERMRCGVCGTENSTRLHYFHVEGDSAHRLQNCDDCGQYQRMVFHEDLSIPVAMEVEDVVMAKLDAIALDPRFRAE